MTLVLPLGPGWPGVPFSPEGPGGPDEPGKPGGPTRPGEFLVPGRKKTQLP